MNTLLHLENIDFLSKLSNLFAKSTEVYKQYIDGGKKFIYAQELKEINTQVLQLLQEKKGLLPLLLQNDANELILHYIAWTNKWEEHFINLQPSLRDMFAFENTVTFPRPSASRLEAHRLTLQAAIANRK